MWASMRCSSTCSPVAAHANRAVPPQAPQNPHHRPTTARPHDALQELCGTARPDILVINSSSNSQYHTMLSHLHCSRAIAVDVERHNTGDLVVVLCAPPLPQTAVSPAVKGAVYVVDLLWSTWGATGTLRSSISHVLQNQSILKVWYDHRSVRDMSCGTCLINWQVMYCLKITSRPITPFQPFS